MEQKKQPTKKAPVALFVFLGLLLIIFIGINSLKKKADNKLDTEIADKPWKALTYEQKEAWITNYINHPDDNGFALVGSMKSSIKKHFQYPEEVSFINDPVLRIGRVVDADRGLTFVEGQVMAKNGFGVKIKHGYSVRLVISKDSLFVDNINVFPYEQ